MKITRSELKGIIKECLRELMTEGVLPQPARHPTINQRVASQAQMIAERASGGDPRQAKILESVLMDTALESETSSQGVMLTEIQQQLPPAQGLSRPPTKNGMGRWAELAFGDYKPQLRGFVG